MKKRLSTMLTVCALLLATMLLPASAQGTSAQEAIVKEKTTGAFVLNEYDQYVAKRKTPDIQLLAEGYTQDEVDILKSTAIEEILLERAQYSTERLKALGYTENQISILRTYDGGPLEDNPQLRGTFADLYGVVLKMAANQTSITLRLSWRWSNAPAMSGIAVHDLMAATWKASNSQGSTINVKLNTSKSSSYVHYYNGYTGNLEATEKQTITVNDPYSSAYVNFTMGRWMFGWAKDGWFDVCVDRVGSGNIYELAMVMGYGHSTFTVTPSVSFSSTGALGIGFSFSGRMEQMYQQALTCRYDGTITNY